MLLPRTRQLLAEKKPVRVVLYGDSISEVKKGWNGAAKTPEVNWGAVLVKRLGEAYPGSTGEKRIAIPSIRGMLCGRKQP